MSTEYSTRSGTPVALVSWGGDEEGTVVRLLPGAAVLLDTDTPLYGDNGLVHTLREIARRSGRNGRLDRLLREKRR